MVSIYQHWKYSKHMMF